MKKAVIPTDHSTLVKVSIGQLKGKRKNTQQISPTMTPIGSKRSKKEDVKSTPKLAYELEIKKKETKKESEVRKVDMKQHTMLSSEKQQQIVDRAKQKAQLITGKFTIRY